MVTIKTTIDWENIEHHPDCRYPNTRTFHHCYHATSYNCTECKRWGTRDHCPLKHPTDRHDYKKEDA